MSNSSETIQPDLHRQFTELIEQKTGIVLNRKPDLANLQKLQNRLSRPLKNLGIRTYEQLWDTLAIAPPDSQEWVEFIHAISTHTTDFFREQAHFDRLAEHARALWHSGHETVLFWSAACSTGEEAVSAAITLHRISAATQAKRFNILATDLDSVVIERARKAIYTKPELSREILKEHFLEGRGDYASYVRVKNRLLASIRYEPLNLVENTYPPASHFDAIFCRNVLIYFNENTRARIVTKLAESLAPGGLLFLGHAESFSYRTDLECVAPTVYRNRQNTKSTLVKPLPTRRGSNQ